MNCNLMHKASSSSVHGRALLPDSFVVLYKITTGELIVQNIQDYIKSNVSLISGKLPFDRLVTQAYIPVGVASSKSEGENILRAFKERLK